MMGGVVEWDGGGVLISVWVRSLSFWPYSVIVLSKYKLTLPQKSDDIF